MSANASADYPAFDTDPETLHETMLGYVNCDPGTGECFAYEQPGVPLNSPLIDYLEGNGNLEKMPPDEPIPDADIALIAAWIDDGAEDN